LATKSAEKIARRNYVKTINQMSLWAESRLRMAMSRLNMIISTHTPKYYLPSACLPVLANALPNIKKTRHRRVFVIMFRAQPAAP
jgi:hypothetical protein